MARPRKTNSDDYRTPTFHPRSNRWRLRIEHAHGEKVFWWPAESATANCPPQIVAAAVEAQKRWRELCRNWQVIKLGMRDDQPELDWSKPVWVEPERLDAIRQRAREQMHQITVDKQRQVLDHVARYGVRSLVEQASQPHALAMTGKRAEQWAADDPELLKYYNDEREHMRAQLVLELGPARTLIAKVTVRQALTEYLEDQFSRTKLKVGDVLHPNTYKALRKSLLAVFGLSAAADKASNFGSHSTSGENISDSSQVSRRLR